MMRTNEHDQEAPMNQSARREGVGEPQCALAASNGGHRGALMAIVIALALSASARSQCQYESHGWSPFPCGGPFFTVYTGIGLNDLGAWCGYRLGCTTETNFPVYCPPGDMPQVLPMPAGASAGGAQATAVNNAGVVVGFKYVGASDQYLHGVIWWPDGSVETIPPPPGLPYSRAIDINSEGVIVGETGHLPYVLKDGVMTLLPDGGLGGGYALRIADSGHVIGILGNPNLNARGFRWRDGVLMLLEPLPGFPVTLANGVNSLGHVVGQSRTASSPATGVPTLWINDQPIALPMPPGYTTGGAQRINDAGVAIGSCSGPGLPSTQMLWIDGAVHILNTLTVPGSPSVGSIVRINQAGQLLSSGGPRLWSPTWSSPMDLNGDCAVNGSDLGVLLAAWGAPDFDARCDFNGDGIVDGHDLGTLLGAWTIHW